MVKLSEALGIPVYYGSHLRGVKELLLMKRYNEDGTIQFAKDICYKRKHYELCTGLRESLKRWSFDPSSGTIKRGPVTAPVVFGVYSRDSLFVSKSALSDKEFEKYYRMPPVSDSWKALNKKLHSNYYPHVRTVVIGSHVNLAMLDHELGHIFWVQVARQVIRTLDPISKYGTSYLPKRIRRKLLTIKSNGLIKFIEVIDGSSRSEVEQIFERLNTVDLMYLRAHQLHSVVHQKIEDHIGDLIEHDKDPTEIIADCFALIYNLDIDYYFAAIKNYSKLQCALKHCEPDMEEMHLKSLDTRRGIVEEMMSERKSLVLALIQDMEELNGSV